MVLKKIREFFLPSYLIIFQIAFIILLGVFGEYKNEESNKEVPGLYAMWMDVHTMMFIGFGFLMTFLKRYGYSSVGYNFLVAAFVLEWSILVRGWIDEGMENGNGKFELSIHSLLVADFCSAAVLISFGAVLGKASLSQLLVMATIEVVIQSFNEYIGLEKLKAYDVGESIYVHVFGAYFGLTVAKILHNKTIKSETESAVYNSDLFAMIGTIFLWLYWPSFNSAVAVEEGQLRAIINTYISISASCITTFIVSHIVCKKKFNMVHIQNATLAGGVAIGAIADMAIHPFSAALVGSVTGVISTLGYRYLHEFLNHHFKLHDTCGVNNLHGIPGLISGFASIIVAATATSENFGGDSHLYKFYPSRKPESEGGLGRTSSEQAWFQLAALAMTISFAIASGVLTGIVIRLPIFEQIKNEDDMFTDKDNWLVPEDFVEDGVKKQAESFKDINWELKKIDENNQVDLNSIANKGFEI